MSVLQKDQQEKIIRKKQLLFDTFIYMQNSSPFMRDMKNASDRNQIYLFSLQNIALYKAT